MEWDSILTMKQFNIFHTMLLRRNRIMLKNRTAQLALHALKLQKYLRKCQIRLSLALAQTLGHLLTDKCNVDTQYRCDLIRRGRYSVY